MATETKAMLLVIGDLPITIPPSVGKYEMISPIGNGSFSTVLLAKNKLTHAHNAIKVVSRQHLVQNNLFTRFEQEVRILQSMNHPHIIKVEDCLFDAELIYVVMEHCSMGDLFKYISTMGRLREGETARLFHQICSGVNYLHKHGVCHRDLKPENILLDDQMNIKIADFGLCHTIGAQQLLQTPCGSPFYAPPEIIQNTPYDGKKGDIWSIGVVLFTMITGSLPWTETNHTKLYQQISNANFFIPPGVPKMIKDTILQMMNKDPDARPLLDEVMKTPWLANIVSQEALMSTKLRGTLSDDHIPSTSRSPGNRNYSKKLIVRPNPNNSVNLSTDLTSLSCIVRRVPALSKKKHSSVSFI